MVHNSEAYNFAKEVIEKEIKKKIEHTLQQNPCPIPRSVKSVSETLDKLLSNRETSSEPSPSEQPESLHNRIEKLLDPIKPYILGGTPMCRALSQAENVFETTETKQKVLLIVTDGDSADGDPRPLAKTLRDKDVTIATCFLTSDDIDKPKCLYDPREQFLSSGKQTLFEMSSSMKNTHTPISYLVDAGWELPLSGESCLFIQANSLDVVNEFCKIVVSQLTQRCDALVHLLEKVPLATYINQENAEFKPKKQEGGTCYANAIAAVFHLAMHRIIGREGGIPDFYEIRDHLIAEYGVKGANTEGVLTKVCPKYRLHFRKVDERGARQAINKRQPVVATFRLYKEQWTKLILKVLQKNS